jgi:DnaK suppressor protein
MNFEERERVRVSISQRIAELRIVVESDSKGTDQIELDQTRVGRLARMDAVQHHAIAQAQGDRASKQLKLLELLLSKVDDEDFGECHYCGEDIPVGRLLIRPESLRCVACAELED